MSKDSSRNPKVKTNVQRLRPNLNVKYHVQSLLQKVMSEDLLGLYCRSEGMAFTKIFQYIPKYAFIIKETHHSRGAGARSELTRSCL